MKHSKQKRFAGLALVLLIILSSFSATAFAVDSALIDKTKDVQFTIHKYDVPKGEESGIGEAGNGEELTGDDIPNYDGLKDAVFAMYKCIGDGDTYADEASFTITTDGNGEATVTVPAAQQGKYFVKEITSPDKVITPVESFYVYLPMTNAAKTGWNYDVHVYPKNITYLGSVELTKTVDGAAMPANKYAEFDLYKITDNGNIKINTESLRTNADGKITVGDLTVGKYQFVETKAPDGFGINPTPVPFEIKSDDNYEVVKVSFDNKGEPTIGKQVSVDGTNFGDVAGADIGKDVTWKLTPVIPTDIVTYSKYIVTDKIDTKLDFKGLDTVTVKTGETTLEKDKDYTLAYDEATRELKVTFIDGDFKGGQTALSGKTDLSITFKTVINNTAVMGADIPNQGILTFNNSHYAEDKTTPSPTPVVHTGGINYVKVDANDSNKKLSGAEFTLYASEADAKAGTNAIAKATSGDNGEFSFTGLAYGGLNDSNDTAETSYYMVETKAPDGYQLVNTVIEVKINKDSFSSTQANPIQIKNVPTPPLPLTGGMGTALFMITGLVLIGISAVLFVRYKKSAKKAK